MTECIESRGQGPRVAFVAGGGGVKSYCYHLGVLRAMEEAGFQFRSGLRWEVSAETKRREITTYVGSSAGSCIVCCLASGHPVEEMRQALFGTAKTVPLFGYRTLFVPVAPRPGRYLRRLGRRWELGSLKPHHLVELSGFLTTRGVERYFRKHVLATNRFGDLAAELFLVATQVNTSRKVVFGPVDSFDACCRYDPNCAYYDNIRVSDALAASVSVPPIFAPYTIVNPATGKKFHYYDGEVRDALSAHVARDAGADFTIASNIWSPYQYDEKIGNLGELGMSAVAEQAIHQSFEQKIDQDRQRTARYQRLLEMIEARDREQDVDRAETERFTAEVAAVLQHRPTRALHVAPSRSDHEFFFGGTFRFDRAFIDRCVDAGYRAFRRAVEDDPDFLGELDQAAPGVRSPDRCA